MGKEQGDWLSPWAVIGRDSSFGDPIFIDSSNSNFPVYTAAHGEGIWSPELISGTYADFLLVIEKLETLAANRRNPVEMQKNPMTQEEYDSFINFVSANAELTDTAYWEILVADDEAGIGPKF
nr:hypothetical protein [uncultured Desulfobacter sp.]